MRPLRGERGAVLSLGESNHLVPIEERHRPLRDTRWVDALTRIRQDPLLLHGDLQHAAKGSVVRMDRRWAMPAAISSFDQLSTSSAGRLRSLRVTTKKERLSWCNTT